VRTIRYDRAGVRIDLGGIAKGYAVDNCITILKGRGITNAIVTAGGDSRLLGDRRGRPGMSVSVTRAGAARWSRCCRLPIRRSQLR